MYSTGDKSYPSAEQAMIAGRLRDYNRCESNNEYGIKTRREHILEELRDASPSSTLSKYTEYCNGFMEELDKREKKYKGKIGEFNR